MKTLKFKPVEMTETVMKELEAKNLIYMLTPGHDHIDAPEGKTLTKSLYRGEDVYGPHKIISVTVNCATFSSFGSHPDNEEFLFIGDPNTKPIYLLICYLPLTEFNIKLKDETLTEDDFILLKAKYNDPYSSFFVMNKLVLHGEATVVGPQKPGTFYVTESENLPLDIIPFENYSLEIEV